MDSRISQVQVMKNKRMRGQVLRTLSLFYPTPIDIGTLKSALLTRGISVSAEAATVLHYLEDKEYIRFKFIEEKMAEMEDGDLVELTSKGIDLLEGTLTDAGVDL